MKFTRQNFIDYVFQPYNTAVKRGEYEKIDYGTWRAIRDWAYGETWSSHDMEVEELNEGYSVGLYHQLRTCPVPMYIGKNDNAFGSWLGDHRMEIMMWDMDIRAVLNQPLTSYDVNNDCSMKYIKSEPSNLTIGYGRDSNNSTASAHFSADAVYFDGKTLQETINQCLEKANIQVKEKENNNMKFNFDFGPVDSSVRMSLYGMAIKNASGTYVAYDANSKQVMDVDIFNFEGANKLIYKMPVAAKDVRAGDVVIHARKPMFVQMVRTDNRLSVLDIFDGEEKTIVLTKSPFGFDFVTKVVSLIDMNGAATAGNPFGNMLPLLLMSDKKSDDLLPLALMASGNMDMSNPMMMWALMGNRTNDPMMLALAMGAFNKPATTYACNGNCHCHEDTDHADK